MEPAVGGTQMGNFIPNIITIKTKNMESGVGGTQMENLHTKLITIMTKKLKNKTPGTYFFTLPTTMPTLHRDILQLIFLELEHGRDMLNFSEVSRRCQQFFQQQIKIIHKPATWRQYERKYMKNNHNREHGIRRGWYNGKLTFENNYLDGQLHGISRGWYSNGQLSYEENFYQDQPHGICRGWYPNGQLVHEYNYVHGQKIEK